MNSWFVLLVFGMLAGFVASTKGRNPVLWFVIGFFFPLIGLIIIAVLPDLRVQRRRSYQYDDYTPAGYRGEPLPQRDPPGQWTERGPRAPYPPVPPPPITAPPVFAEQDLPRDWYYEENRQVQGPVTLHALRIMLSEGRLNPASLVWAEHIPDWRPASSMPELRNVIR